MKFNKIVKWIYSHQFEVAVIIISLITLIIGLIAIGPLSILIVGLLDVIVFLGPNLYSKIIKKKPKKEKEKKREKKEEVKKREEEKGSEPEVKKKKGKESIFAKKKEKKLKVKEPKEKKKKTKRKILKVILLIILLFMIIGLVAMCVFFAYIAKNAPSFNPDELYSSESTIVYASDGETVIAKLGAQKREKITYEEIPEVFIDALIATEDSRFFQHNGFDFPRFIKASIGQVLGNSSAGGASTITMQISKNAFTSTEASGIKGIIRKFTDIYMSIFEIEKNYSKQEILEFYVNNNLLGGNNYGIEQASIAYFGKSAKDLNLSEAAILAGMYQSPNAYNPITKPENAASRRKTVLKLMVRHGYITQEEADIANSIPVESLTKNGTGGGDDTLYQGFIDTVVSEIKQDTGYNPYTTAMKIYSTIIPEKQDAVNAIMNGSNYDWENDKVQAGIAVLDTKTGAIVAVGTNRDSSASGLLNHATFENQTKRQIGSTAKPLYDYGPAIEYNNASPGDMVADEPYTYSGGQAIQNFDSQYKGFITYRVALAGSRNIPALKVFQSVKQSNIISFVTGLGLSPEISNGYLHEAHAIGGYNGESPLTMAAAYATIGNMGVYNSPHSYTKLIYRDTGEEVIKEVESHRVMSEETAYILNSMLMSVAQTGLGNYSYVNGYTYGAKTGTTNFSAETKAQNNLASTAINDLWIDGVTDEYAISIWYGYDKIYQDAYSKFGNQRHLALFRTLASQIWTRSAQYTKPDGVLEVEIEQDCVESKLPSAYTPSSMRTVELFKKGSEPTEVSTRFSQLKNVTNLKYTSSNGEITLTWTKVDNDWLDRDYIMKYYSAKITNDYWLNEWTNKRVEWNSANLGNIEYDIYEKLEDDTYKLIGTSITNSFTFEPTNTNGTYVVKTEYSKYKSTNSKGATITAKVSGTPIYSVSVENESITQGETYNYEKNVTVSSSTCKLSKITVGTTAFTSWNDANTSIKSLPAGSYSIKAQYICGNNSNKTILGTGTLTISPKAESQSIE